MSQIIKPVMLDETGQAANQRLDTLGNKLDSHKEATAQKLTELGNEIDSHKEATAQKLTELGGKLEGVGAKLQNISDAIESVHSVNGMTGDVVIDSTNIKVNKMDSGSKSIAQVLSDEQSSVNGAVSNMQSNVNAAIQRLNEANIPVSFSTSEIESDDYLLTIATASL